MEELEAIAKNTPLGWRLHLLRREITHAYEAGDNVGFGGINYDDSYKKAPYNGFTG